MKKLVIALIIFVLVAAAATVEIIYTTDAFTKLEMKAQTVVSYSETCVELKQRSEREREASGEESPDLKAELKAAEERAIAEMTALIEAWESKRIGALVFGNHTVAKSVDDRLASMLEQGNVGQWEDASVTAAAIRVYFRDLKDDTHPSLSNFF